MKLPERDYYGIFDIVNRWNRQSGESYDFKDVFEYIRQGKLRVVTHHHGDYFEVSENLSVFFDLRFIDTTLIDNFYELSLADLKNPSIRDFEDAHDVKVDTNIKDIYVHISELKRFENTNNSSINPNSEANTTERKKLSIIILALAKHAKIDVTDSGKAAIVIMKEADELGLSITRNTVVKHLDNALDSLPKDQRVNFSFN